MTSQQFIGAHSRCLRDTCLCCGGADERIGRKLDSGALRVQRAHRTGMLSPPSPAAPLTPSKERVNEQAKSLVRLRGLQYARLPKRTLRLWWDVVAAISLTADPLAIKASIFKRMTAATSLCRDGVNTIPKGNKRRKLGSLPTPDCQAILDIPAPYSGAMSLCTPHAPPSVAFPLRAGTSLGEM